MPWALEELMDVLAEVHGKRFVAISIRAPSDFVSPFPGELFPCLIWDHDGRLGDTDRSGVANALLLSGCRYAVCGGKNCDAWHLAVDLEFVAAHTSPEAQAAAFVMTAGFEEEEPDDVAFFFVRLTNFDWHDFRSYLVLHVGGSPLREQVDNAVRDYASGARGGCSDPRPSNGGYTDDARDSDDRRERLIAGLDPFCRRGSGGWLDRRSGHLLRPTSVSHTTRPTFRDLLRPTASATWNARRSGLAGPTAVGGPGRPVFDLASGQPHRPTDVPGAAAPRSSTDLPDTVRPTAPDAH